MSTERDENRIVLSWLRADEHVSADRILDDVFTAVDATPQRPSSWRARRSNLMTKTVRVIAAAAAVFVVAFLAFLAYQLLVAPNVGDPPTVGPINFTDLPGEAELQPGEYLIDYAEPVALVTFTVPDQPYEGHPSPFYKGEADWGPWHQDHMARLGVADVENLYVDPCDPALGLRDPAVGPSVEELITALGEVPGVRVSEPVESTVGGLTGQYVELTGAVPEGCVEEPFIWTTTRGDSSLLLPRTGDSGHVWLHDVDGQRLVIWLRRDAGRPDDGGAVEDLLDSLVIEAP